MCYHDRVNKSVNDEIPELQVVAHQMQPAGLRLVCNKMNEVRR
jgi:hypothetical protein